MSRDSGVLLKSVLDLPSFISGKVRDTYLLEDYLLIVATDRISAFDVILPCGIPNKGKVLNQISGFWFDKTRHIVKNHLVEMVTVKTNLNGRSMFVKKAERLPLECVVRGYLAGSGWSEYKKQGTVCGVKLPPGLVESQRLPEPIFTPTTKAEAGHDMPMTMPEMKGIFGGALAEKLRATCLAVYNYASDYAASRGFIIADTKMEFGMDGGSLILIDELLTPDSSRFWEVKSYKAGRAQDSFDKQPVRDWLETTAWNKEPPAPMLPCHVIESTAKRYESAFERLTGQRLQ